MSPIYNSCVAPQFDVAGVGLNATDTLLVVPRFPAYAGKVPFEEEIVSAGGHYPTRLIHQTEVIHAAGVAEIGGLAEHSHSVGVALWAAQTLRVQRA